MDYKKVTISISNGTIKRGKMMAAAEGKSFSKLVAELVDNHFKPKDIEKAANACEIKPDKITATNCNTTENLRN